VLFKVVFVEIAAFFAEILAAQPTDETDLLFKKKRLRYFDPLLWHRSGISAEKKCLQ
jgi:hypothetical protein